MSTNYSGVGYRMLRRAQHLRYALGMYPSSSADARTLIDSVALVVTCEEYDQLKADPLLWQHYYADFALPKDGDMAELRLCGILVLPR